MERKFFKSSRLVATPNQSTKMEKDIQNKITNSMKEYSKKLNSVLENNPDGISEQDLLQIHKQTLVELKGLLTIKILKLVGKTETDNEDIVSYLNDFQNRMDEAWLIMKDQNDCNLWKKHVNKLRFN
ncbi:unnamed protein product [Orchesella dallaii]|uniref:Uncharacterized protein n=1 Tax=Orchesella dallaii TaxID=48710 RepID=A0ABP1S282_9HEXA